MKSTFFVYEKNAYMNSIFFLLSIE